MKFTTSKQLFNQIVLIQMYFVLKLNALYIYFLQFFIIDIRKHKFHLTIIKTLKNV